MNAQASQNSTSGDRPWTLTEEKAVEERRETLALGDPQAPRIALALSGGGIRSATFSLGVVQAMAEAPADGQRTSRPIVGAELAQPEPGQAFKASFLSRVDYLSTVSGGGYLGGFLCSLFVPGRLIKASKTNPDVKQCQRTAADHAVGVLSSGAPQRIHSAPYSDETILAAPLAWLRENGRYLLPTGAGDALYVMAIGLRNWISLHFVIGTAMIAFMAVLLLIRSFAADGFPLYRNWEANLLSEALRACSVKDSGLTDCIWWSPLSVLWLLPLATVGLVSGFAYWLVHDTPSDTSHWFNNGVKAMGFLGLLCVFIAASYWPEDLKLPDDPKKLPFTGDVLRMGVVLVLGLIALAAVALYSLCISVMEDSASRQRVVLTRILQWSLTVSLAVAALAIVETLGQTLYLAASKSYGVATTLSPAAVAGGLSWLVQHLAKSKGSEVPGVLRKLPLMTLAGLAGMLIFVLVGALWVMAVHLMLWGGNSPDTSLLLHKGQSSILLWLVGVPVVVAFCTGLFPAFINMSSLQPFYGARLTRAYLGASNGERFRESDIAKRSAAEPMDSDQLPLTAFHTGHDIKTLAPLHIVNVCSNKTVDPAEQLVQRDRKGQPLAVLPFGVALDSGQVDYFQQRKAWIASAVDRPLSLGQWIGTSGAAFSTGIGRETTLGMSLLMGAANVRLGTWWPVPPKKTEGAERPKRALRHVAGLIFRTQRYLSYELRASFHGTNRSWQYLSDGGHFENTGIYELLRPQRKIAQIFASDNGADPIYQFDDLANLIRLARIDLKVDVKVADPPADGPLAGLFGRPEDFKAFCGMNGKPAAPAPPKVPIAVLLYACHQGNEAQPTQIVLIKPNVSAEVPADVRQYAVTRRQFPQEPTADQFFDEAQWESYRSLGYCEAKRIFMPEVRKALDEHRAEVAGRGVPDYDKPRGL